jgi:hypothetical protein
VFWGLLGVGLALGGTGVPLIAEPGTGFWGIAGWVLLAAGVLCLMAAAVVLAKRRGLAAPGISAEAIVSEASAVSGSVVGNVIQGSTVNVGATGVEDTATPKRDVVRVTPGWLIARFKDHTDVQAQKLVEPYIGKWIRVSGKLNNVMSSSEHFVQVTFQPAKTLFERDTEDPDDWAMVWMYFPKDQEADLALLPRGAPLTVLGRIDRIDAVNVHLQDCELEDA